MKEHPDLAKLILQDYSQPFKSQLGESGGEPVPKPGLVDENLFLKQEILELKRQLFLSNKQAQEMQEQQENCKLVPSLSNEWGRKAHRGSLTIPHRGKNQTNGSSIIVKNSVDMSKQDLFYLNSKRESYEPKMVLQEV